MRFLLIFALGVGFCVSVRADRERSFFQASRALAMGDAYTAVDLGFEAVYYNPAGVANRNKPQVKLADLELVGSQTLIGFVSSFSTKLFSLQKIIDEVAANPGRPYSVGFDYLPQFLVKNFSLGGVARTFTEAYVDAGTSNLNLYAYSDIALYAHFGVTLFGGMLKLGAGFKAIDRAEINRAYTPAEYTTSGISFTSQWKEGVGFGLDLGALLAFPAYGLPTIGLVVQDVGNTVLKDRRLIFSGDLGTPGQPPTLKQRVNVGFGMTLKHDRGVKTVLSVEEKDILKRSSLVDYVDRFHAGAELGFNDAFFLRGGVNQGRYWTAGLGFRLGGTGFEFATYGENISFTPGTRISDRKYVGRYVYTF